MKHINKEDIQKLIIAPEKLSFDQITEIRGHLKDCSICREYYELEQEFYKNFESELEIEPTDKEYECVKSLLSTELVTVEHSLVKQKKVEQAVSTFFEFVEPKKTNLPQRVINYIKINPVRKAAGFAFAACLFALATLYIKPFKDTQPDYAKAKDDFLVVYNKNGDELWRKRIGDGFDATDISAGASRLAHIVQNLYLNVLDVDNDDTKEIIVSFQYCVERKDKNRIYCFNDKGEEKWVYTFNRKMKFGAEDFDDSYTIYQFIIGDFDKNGSKELAVILNHSLLYPSCLILLNASNGELLNEYWHTGSLRMIKNIDIDKDGIEEIIAVGENNGYNLASLLIVDPRYLNGYSPAPKDYTPENVKPGNEKYYLLFDRPDIAHYVFHKRNFGYGIFIYEDNSFLIHISEEVKQNEFVFLNYVFNSNVQCIKVDAEDKFVNFRNKLVKEGKLSGRIDTNYLEKIKQGIMYWDGDKFVNYPTINKHYVEAVNKKESLSINK